MIQINHIRYGFSRPFESCFFQTLVPQYETCVVPAQYFQFIAALVTKHEDGIGVRGQHHCLFDNDRKSINGFSKIYRVSMQIDLGDFGKPVHVSAFTRVANQSGSTDVGSDNSLAPRRRVMLLLFLCGPGCTLARINGLGFVFASDRTPDNWLRRRLKYLGQRLRSLQKVAALRPLFFCSLNSASHSDWVRLVIIGALID